MVWAVFLVGKYKILRVHKVNRGLNKGEVECVKVFSRVVVRVSGSKSP